MEEIIVWISAESRLPRGHSEHKGERGMAWSLSERRLEAADGPLHPAHRTASPGFRNGRGTTAGTGRLYPTARNASASPQVTVATQPRNPTQAEAIGSPRMY